MTGTTDSLLDVLETCDMLEIDGLHAFEFTRPDEGGLRIESMDGRKPKRWFFTPAEVATATFDTASQSWLITNANGEHRLICMDAFTASEEDDQDDDSPAS